MSEMSQSVLLEQQPIIPNGAELGDSRIAADNREMDWVSVLEQEIGRDSIDGAVEAQMWDEYAGKLSEENRQEVFWANEVIRVQGNDDLATVYGADEATLKQATEVSQYNVAAFAA